MVMNSAPTHHPDSEVLLARAAGGLDPAIALAVSAHLDLCPRCARRAAMLDVAGGTVLEQTPPVELSPGALERTLDRLDGAERPVPETAAAAAKLHTLGLEKVPRSLRPLTAAAAEKRGWKRYPGGVSEFLLRKDPHGVELRYLLVPPGIGVPRHTHAGTEVTVVVTGAFRDETGVYGRGDLEICTADLTHRPVAGTEEPCLAFTVINAPLRFTGALGALQRAFGSA